MATRTVAVLAGLVLAERSDASGVVVHAPDDCTKFFFCDAALRLLVAEVTRDGAARPVVARPAGRHHLVQLEPGDFVPGFEEWPEGAWIGARVRVRVGAGESWLTNGKGRRFTGTTAFEVFHVAGFPARVTLYAPQRASRTLDLDALVSRD